MSELRPDLRPDLAAIAAMIRSGARVLDVGCGDGALLEHLKAKDVDGRGIEISQANVNACVARGLAVVQGDADSSKDDLFHQFGILKDDYTPKPAFDRLARLYSELSQPPA